MYDRLFKPPQKDHFYLFGPRGTGKTSFLKVLYPNAPYFDLLEDDVRFDLGQSAKNLGKRVDVKYRGPVIIDEVQKLPSLLDEVHRLIESRPALQFILTGSSAVKLKQGAANLMAGRARVERLYPLTASELGKDFDLRKALRVGMLPKAWASAEPTSFLKSYVQTYLDLEIKLEGLSRDLPGFRRFLEAASFSQGAVLNIANVASECGVERRTVSNYFQLLQDLLLAYELPVFARRAKRKLIQHRKFYFFDCGVFRVLRPRGPLDSDAEIDGAAFETLVLQELMAQNDYRKLEYAFHFWRTQSKREVDFVLYGPRGLVAIETKISARLRQDDFSGLLAFREDYPAARSFMIYGGEKSYQEGAIRVLTLADFFLQLDDILEG